MRSPRCNPRLTLATALVACASILAVPAAEPEPAPAPPPAPTPAPAAVPPAAPPPAVRNIGGPGDYALREKLMYKLRTDADLKDAGLQLALVNGGAVFSGTAPTWSLKRRALNMAAGTRGIVNVTDRVQIPRSAAKDEEMMKAITDVLVERKENLSIESIEVRVEESVVTLSGVVDNFAARVRVEEVTGYLPGATRIINTLRPKTAPSGTDDVTLRKAVAGFLRDFREYPYVGDLTVQVKDGRAILGGQLPIFLARQQAGVMAALVGGVRGVDNRIRIEPSLQVQTMVVEEVP